MENYVVRVVIETINGKVVGQEIFDTHSIIEIKAFGGTSIVDNFITDTLNEIANDRRDNPHHHQNRLD